MSRFPISHCILAPVAVVTFMTHCTLLAGGNRSPTKADVISPDSVDRFSNRQATGSSRLTP